MNWRSVVIAGIAAFLFVWLVIDVIEPEIPPDPSFPPPVYELP